MFTYLTHVKALTWRGTSKYRV